MSLNVPYTATLIGDYLWLASIVSFWYIFAANENETPLSVAACIVFTGVIVTTAREHVYSLFLAPYLAKVKTDFRLSSRPSILFHIFRTTGIITASGACMAHFGLMNCHLDGLLSTALVVSRDYWAINLIKDNTSMRFIHPWMHKKENYWIHKHHHTGNRDTTQPHAFVLDIFDLIIEFSVGSVLAVLANLLLFGNPSVHILSFLFSIWTDQNVHSQNPYTQAIGNPILDAIFKLNICHNLHHACKTDQKYMVVFPLHHLNSAERNVDIERYNQIMKTKVDFRILKSV